MSMNIPTNLIGSGFSQKNRINFGSLGSNSYNTVEFHHQIYCNVTKVMQTKILINVNEEIIKKKRSLLQNLPSIGGRLGLSLLP